MDDLLSEFLTETVESLDVIDVELVKFEQESSNENILSNIFRLVHTIKGTCGFLGLPRLEALAHAAETLMGKYRDGAEVTPDGVSLILNSIDRIKEILVELEQTGCEPEGDDKDLISQLVLRSEIQTSEEADVQKTVEDEFSIDEIGNIERELQPGEVSLEELERAFREAPGPDELTGSQVAEKRNSKTTTPAVKKDQSDRNESPQTKEGRIKSQTIRVNVDTLEQLMTMVSELVLTRNQLLEMDRRYEESQFKVPLQRLSNVTAELQEGVMKTRMQPIGNAWQKLPRIIRDLSRELDKKINLEMIGAQTELDRQVLEQIKDPLTHMVRNSADHGLESTSERTKLGKSEVGNITLRAYHEGGHIIIEISDDGRGLDVDKIRSKAVNSGYCTEAELSEMSEQQLHKLIFHAGLSTASEVTSVSGRGVGMDVVRTNIELIGGTVDLKSVKGEGTSFTIKIPLTLAIVSALIVEASGQRFAIPQLSVIELVRAHSSGEHRIEMINNTPLLRLRNQLLPIIYLHNVLNLQSNEQHTDRGAKTSLEDDNTFVIVMQVGQMTFGIVVDSVFHTEEIVVKPMSSKLRDITMFSGNTILGDGSVIMIIDPNGISQEVLVLNANLGNGEDVLDITSETSNDRTTAMLLFRAGSNEQKAVPLSLVTRLEEIEVQSIEYLNGRNMVQYRGLLMPLISISEETNFQECGRQPILVFADEHRSMGLVVDEIIDIVDAELRVEIASNRAGCIGSAVIKGSATEIVDIGYYLPQAFNDWLDLKDRKETRPDMNLLLVDDSAFFRNMLAPLLGAAGYKVTLADSAVNALSLMDQSNPFDVIVTDIEMPEMDGIAFAETLKKEDSWAHIPIVALSSKSSSELINRSRAAGFNDYVAKFDREGLFETLQEFRSNMGQAA